MQGRVGHDRQQDTNHQKAECMIELLAYAGLEDLKLIHRQPLAQCVCAEGSQDDGQGCRQRAAEE